MRAIQMPEKLYTIQEIAEDLRVSRSTVQGWISSKKLAATKYGGIYRIAQSDLDDFQRRGRTIQEEVSEAKEEE